MNEMSGTEEKRAEEKKSDMMGKVALGAGGLAVVSGVAVAGVMLARNKKARKALRKGVDQAVKGAIHGKKRDHFGWGQRRKTPAFNG